MGTNPHPQCLHFFASFNTSSLQSGHLTCVYGDGKSLSVLRLRTAKANIRPISGLNIRDNKKNPNPDLPLFPASTPTAIDKRIQTKPISINHPIELFALSNVVNIINIIIFSKIYSIFI